VRADNSSVSEIGNRKSKIENGFSLVEVLVVITLLSLIVLVLMAVFSSTQRAFRAAVTQTDVLEGSRATMEMIAADLRTITPSYGVSNGPVNLMTGPTYYAYTPLLQTLPGGSVLRTNALNYFFLLSRDNINGHDSWIGVGYAVNAASASPLLPLYRFYTNQDISLPPRNLYDTFTNVLYFQQWTNASMSHLIDGVVHLTLHAYDRRGRAMDNYYPATNAPMFKAYPPNPPYSYETPFNMFSNTVPAEVELELGVLEDRALARAESLPFQTAIQSNYLAQQSGAVHLFRQRVSIPDVDPSAYP
jgi:prepilin-type N-terminal cleavage/methylation domain-containing protein